MLHLPSTDQTQLAVKPMAIEVLVGNVTLLANNSLVLLPPPSSLLLTSPPLLPLSELSPGPHTCKEHTFLLVHYSHSPGRERTMHITTQHELGK